MIIALMGGGDWTDASFELLVPPDGADPEADVRAYPGYREAGRRHEAHWLKEEKGWRDARQDEARAISENPW